MPDVGGGQGRQEIRWGERDGVPHAALGAAQGIPRRRLRRGAGRRRAPPPGGGEPPALCGADPGRGPAAGLRLGRRSRRAGTPWCGTASCGWRMRSPADFAPEAFDAPAACDFERRPLLAAGDRRRRPAVPAAAAGARRRPPPPLPAGPAARPRPRRWSRRSAPPPCRARHETPAAAPHGAADPGGRRFRRGRVVHALLQHLPERPAAERAAAAGALPRPARPRPDRRGAGGDRWPRCWRCSRRPEVVAAFGPDSLAEAPIAGRLDGRLVTGQVDRLVVDAGPRAGAGLQDQPAAARPTRRTWRPLYLRQMAAYRAVLRAGLPRAGGGLRPGLDLWRAADAAAGGFA